MNEKYVLKSRAIASRIFDGEMIIMSAQDSALFSLNAVATLIWEAADGKAPLSEIVRNRVCELFEVQFEEAYSDAQIFIHGLEAHGIVRVQSHPFLQAEFNPDLKP